MFPLTNDEKGRLQRLNRDQAVMFALKKLFINEAVKHPSSYDTQFLAAQKIAELMIDDIFHQLSVIQSDNSANIARENVV